MVENRDSELRDMMLDFAEATGLYPVAETPTRYLWTDAFALCNFLELFRRTGEERFRELALRLVEQVHQVLGRHRGDDSRRGWISGLDELEGRNHPTAGGLRIGKPLRERGSGGPFDDRLEWERDGQYFHYLTRWMHALDRLARVTGEARYSRWALELAEAACRGFIRESGGGARMVWKMSIDLSRPLVPSMGQHDPLDGLLTCLTLWETARSLKVSGPELRREVETLGSICRGMDWASGDPLGIGGLLFDSWRAARLIRSGRRDLRRLLTAALDGALEGLESSAPERNLQLPAEYRLAFRELGLAIGLQAVPRIGRSMAAQPEAFGSATVDRIDALLPFCPLAGAITAYWKDPAHRRSSTWREHLEINRVMLATSLAPGGYLD